MKRYTRLISIILCMAFLVSCMVVPASAAADDTIYSYHYLDFINPVSVAGDSYQNFIVYGDNTITSNVLYVLCSRATDARLNSYYPSGTYSVEIEELWKNGAICCYRLTANTAAAFRGEFRLRVKNNASSTSAFNVYKVFTVAPAGIMKLSPDGLTTNPNICTTSMPAPIHGPKITSFPYIYESHTTTNNLTEYYLDINIPITKFVGMQQGSFVAYAASVTQTHLDLGSYLTSFSLLYNGAPIPYQYATTETTDSLGGYVYYDGEDITQGVNRPLGTFLSVLFDVPQQIPATEAYITARFIYKCDVTPFHFYFQNLYGRYSFAKTEYELLTDIYNALAADSDNIAALATEIDSLRSVLHLDLQSVLAEMKTSNSWLSSIKGVLDDIKSGIANLDFSQVFANILAEVKSGFADTRTYLFNIFGSVDSGFSGISSILGTIGTNSVNFFNKADAWLSSIFGELDYAEGWLQQIRVVLDSVRENIINSRAVLISRFNTLFTQLTDTTNSIVSSISTWGQNIINTLTGNDGGAAEEFEDHAQEQAGQVSDGIGKIDAVEKPDIGNIDANVDDYLDASAVGLLAGTINIFFQNNIFYSIFSLVLLMMLASYVMFGKK